LKDRVFGVGGLTMGLFCGEGGFFVLDVGYAGAEAGVDGLVSCCWE